jgi:hypothetical protein
MTARCLDGSVEMSHGAQTGGRRAGEAKLA